MGDLETKGQSKIVNRVKIEEIKNKLIVIKKEKKREKKRERKKVKCKFYIWIE
jgi:hypothetical protein